jgi:hypothetical protein
VKLTGKNYHVMSHWIMVSSENIPVFIFQVEIFRRSFIGKKEAMRKMYKNIIHNIEQLCRNNMKMILLTTEWKTIEIIGKQ